MRWRSRWRSLLLMPLIGTELLPQTDSGDFTVTMKLPPGTALAKTDAVMRQIEGIMLANPNVQTVYTSVGTGTTRGLTITEIPFEGACTVHLKDNRTRTTQQVIAALRTHILRIPGVRPTLQQFDLVSILLTGGTTQSGSRHHGRQSGYPIEYRHEVMARLVRYPAW